MLDAIHFLIFALVLITLIVCLFLSWHFHHQAKMKERLLLLEKGARPEILLQKETKGKFLWLKIGVLIIGIGVAFGIISILQGLNLIRSNTLPFAILALCIGTSMVLANYLARKNSQA